MIKDNFFVIIRGLILGALGTAIWFGVYWYSKDLSLEEHYALMRPTGKLICALPFLAALFTQLSLRKETKQNVFQLASIGTLSFVAAMIPVLACLTTSQALIQEPIAVYTLFVTGCIASYLFNMIVLISLRWETW